jgi:hypothetical protein
MTGLVFSLSSKDAAELVDRELRRNGVREKDIRFIDGESLRSVADEAHDPKLTMAELAQEIAQGRALLAVEVDEQNQPAVERVIHMLGVDVRKYTIAGPPLATGLPALSGVDDEGPLVEPAS